jgi:recombination protein RecA
MADKVMSPSEFYKKLGKDDKKAIVNLGQAKAIEFVPTGSWVINSLIGDGTGNSKPGGLPRGHIVEVFGDDSSGKTTLALSACKQAQLLGTVPVFLDFEQSFHEAYARALGLDLDPEKFVLIQPNHFEHGAKFIKDSLMMRPSLIVVDSVSAMIPKAFLEGSVDEGGRIGLQAQLMSATLSYFSKHLQTTGTCLLYLNQLRSVIKKSQYERGPDEESSGGRALRYYASVRIKLTKSSKIETVATKSKITGKTDKKPVNILIKATVVKNKIDKPYLAGPVYIRFGEGFDNIYSIIELSINNGTIKKSGAFLRFQKGDKVLFNAQGKESLRKLLTEDKAVFQELQESLRFKEDEQAKEESLEVEEGDEMEQLLTNVSDTFTKGHDKK